MTTLKMTNRRDGEYVVHRVEDDGTTTWLFSASDFEGVVELMESVKKRLEAEGRTVRLQIVDTVALETVTRSLEWLDLARGGRQKGAFPMCAAHRTKRGCDGCPVAAVVGDDCPTLPVRFVRDGRGGMKAVWPRDVYVQENLFSLYLQAVRVVLKNIEDRLRKGEM